MFTSSVYRHARRQDGRRRLDASNIASANREEREGGERRDLCSGRDLRAPRVAVSGTRLYHDACVHNVSIVETTMTYKQSCFGGRDGKVNK